MTTARIRCRVGSKRVAGVLAVFGLCCGSAALSNPVPPAYQNFPVAPGTFASRVGGPVLADDFFSPIGRRIVFVEWWGSRSDAPWALTLYSNTDADPALPDSPVSTISLVEPSQAYAWDDDIFYYRADVNDPAWVLTRGQSYWFGVASREDGWTWAFADGSAAFGSQREAAVVTPDGVNWETLAPSANFAFGLWPELVPEPGSLLLLGIGLTGIALSRRRNKDRRPSG